MTRWAALFFAAVLALCACGGGGGGGAGEAGVDADTGGADVTVAPDAVEAKETPAPDTEEDILCNPYTQEPPCPVDQTCVFDEADQIACIEKGTIPVGGECGPNDPCEMGSCMDLGGTGARCYTYCKTQVHCKPGLQCLGINDKKWKVCELPGEAFKDLQCLLLKQDCKGSKQGCYLTGVTNVPICMTAGAAAEGQACEQPMDCGKGLSCYNKACHALCDKGGGDPKCTDPQTCKVLYWSAEKAGLCAE